LPMFVGEAFGKKVCSFPFQRHAILTCFEIFSTGKSLNFIRYSCHDSDWVATREKMSDKSKSKLVINHSPARVSVLSSNSFEI
jgi:gamma-tubulin complex component 3